MPVALLIALCWLAACGLMPVARWFGRATASAQAAVAPAAASVRSASAAEPSVHEVVRMAIRAARKLGPERVQALARRARLAGLVPQLKLTADRGLRQDLSSSATSATDRTNAATGDDLSLGATLTFDFDRLVFATEEVRLLSVERWLMADQRKLVSDVVKLFFQRRRLIREQASAASTDPELDDQIVEHEALLDEYTDGAFGKALARAQAR